MHEPKVLNIYTNSKTYPGVKKLDWTLHSVSAYRVMDCYTSLPILQTFRPTDSPYISANASVAIFLECSYHIVRDGLLLPDLGHGLLEAVHWCGFFA